MKIMYTFDKSIGLVTVASNINQNLALLDVEDILLADSIAVIHDGFINFIPIFNSDSRRCKYIPASQGFDRDQQKIIQIKWLKIGRETVFIVLSNLGMQIYDAELTEIIFTYQFKHVDKTICEPVGSCVVDSYLCVGTRNGGLFIFEKVKQQFELVSQNFASPVALIAGLRSYVVTFSNNDLFLWVNNNGFLTLKQQKPKQCTLVPSVLRVLSFVVVVGYSNGNLCFFDLPSLDILGKPINAHDGEITDLDYSDLKNLILTVSRDYHIKVWELDDTFFKIKCVFSIKNPEKNHFVGCGFLNMSATQFCVVTENDIKVNVYVNTIEDSNH